MTRDYSVFGKTFKGTVLLTGEEAVSYFSGFYTTARRPKQIGYTAVVLSEKGAKLLIPAKWREQAEKMTGFREIVDYPNTETAYRSAVVKLMRQEDLSLLWVEYEKLGIALYRELSEIAGEIRDITDRLEKIRAIKTPDEIAKLCGAARIAVHAMEAAGDILRYEMTEQEAAAEIEYLMRKMGSEGVPFTMKALAGENSGTVISVPGKRKLQKGDLLLLDFGAQYQGYSSDWTRTFCLGEADSQKREMYCLVRKIQRECIAQIRPGILLGELMETASQVISGHPLEPYFQRYLGHSVGIGSQENPAIEPGSGWEIQENMVLAVEPGIYIPGFGGVRIEDEVLVTKTGCKILTGLREEAFEIQLRGEE